MATLNINGRRVTVDDSFLQLPPDQQEATVEEIAASLGGGSQQPPAPPAQPTAPAEQPWYAQAGQAADDIVRLVANGLTFGYADKLAGYLGGEGTEAERQKSAAAKERAGLAGTVAEIGGAMLPMSAAAGAGLTAMRLVPSSLTGGAGLAARTGAMAAEGAGYGALHAAGHDEDIGQGALTGAAAGAIGNVAGEGLSKAVQKVAGVFNKKPAIPSLDDVTTSARDAYQRAENAGLIYAPQGLQRLSADIKTDLANFGFHPRLQPRVATVLEEIDNLANSNVSLKGVDVLRRIANNARSSLDKSEQELGRRIVEHIDDFVVNPRPGEVLTGNAAAGSSAIREARDLWSRKSKAELVAEAVEKAQRRAESSGSGGNVDNAIRQNLRAILDSKSKSRGFTADEKEALKTAIRGNTTQNTLRLLGKLSPSGNGLMAALGLGATAANPLMAVAPAAGLVSKSIADRATKRNVDDLMKIILAGGQASAARAAPNAVQRLAESKREAIARLMLATGLTVAP